MAKVSERDKESLREFMPDLLFALFGIENTSRSFSCPLPDHEDSDPSAHYYADTHSAHCFGCGRTFDVFDLVGIYFGIPDFPGRARKVAELVGYRLDDDPDAERDTYDARIVRRPPKPPFAKPKDAGAQDCSEACAEAFAALYEDGNEAGRQYLRSRGFDDYDIAENGLGFVRDPKLVMPQFRTFEKGALGFITIPFWERGYTVARYCMARTIPGDGEVKCKEWRPKGVTTPLWNEWMLTAGLPVVYVAEGLLDAIALHKMTDKCVVGLGGVANAKRLSQILYHASPEKRPEVMVVCMDDDEEGNRAAAKIIGDMKRIGVSAASLSPYPYKAKDPDEVLMAGRGRTWDFERWKVDLNGRPLYRTRWRDEG